jgi:apolipoprotein D and lipocalin family protein
MLDCLGRVFFRYFLVLAAIFGLNGALFAETAPLSTVKTLDLQRYLGVWHEISFYPNYFQRKCARDTSAEYSMGEDGAVVVRNRCTTADGAVESVTGMARRVRADDPSRLKVRFAPEWLSWLPLVWGNYWVIGLADDYRYAVVGEPNREYLWILARQPTLSAPDRSDIDALLRKAGYDPQRLVERQQATGAVRQP